MNEPLLRALCNAPGVSGWEDEVRDLARAELAPHADEVRVDRLGNLIAVRRAARPVGDGPPLKVMVAAHMDEIGFMVKAIDQRGFIRVQPVGGFDPRTLVSQRLMIHGRQRVGAVFAPIPNWIESDEERRRVTPLEQLVVDTGLSGDEVRAQVEIGDYVTLAAEFATLNDRVVMARNFDDRLGVYVLVEMLRNLGDLAVDLYAVGTTQEEVGVRGAAVAAYDINPDVGVALDGSVSSDVPYARDDLQYTRLGAGVGIYRFDRLTISDRPLYNLLVDTARRDDIPYQVTMWGGTDASAMQRSRSGALACTVGVPVRYMHSTVQLAHWDDIEGNVALMRSFLARAGELVPHCRRGGA
jgi:endoglucanase